MTCICGHRIEAHDSGGCCQVNFCDCSHLNIREEEVAAKMIDEQFEDSKGLDRQQSNVGELGASYAVESKSVANDPFYSFSIETAEFSDLAVWAFKARDELRRLKGLSEMKREGDGS